MADPVIGHRNDVVGGLLLVALGEFLEDVALGVGQQVIGTGERIGIIGDTDRRVATGGKARARDDHVDGAERQTLINVGFLAEL